MPIPVGAKTGVVWQSNASTDPTQGGSHVTFRGPGKEACQHARREVIGWPERRYEALQAEGIHVGCLYLGPGGLVGYHPAATYQLFAVIKGDGWVRGEGAERVPIRAGQAAFWQPGEHHEAGTDAGMTALVVETDALGGDPAAIGPLPPPDEAASRARR